MPASMPEFRWPSRFSLLECKTVTLSVVVPSFSVKVAEFSASASGKPSNTSVETSRSDRSISRYVPCQPSSVPSASWMT